MPIWQNYIQCSISYSMLASKLNMSVDNAEKWIVNLIREARLDAKIDAKEVINTHTGLSQ